MEEQKKTRAKNYVWFIGIDISKETLDFALTKENEFQRHDRIANLPDVIRGYLTEVKKTHRLQIARTIFCMENTGVYGNHLVRVLEKMKANIVVEPAVHIIRRLGIVRGKDDMVDAKRIAEYAHKYRKTLKFRRPRRPVIERLAQLNTLRTRLLAYHRALAMPVKEEALFIRKSLSQQNLRLCESSLKSLKQDVAAVDGEILTLIKTDEALKHLFDIIVSVRDVGPITAIHILICTNEFLNIKNPKKFACYAGVAPFANESGLRKSKRKVSTMANKKMKALLHTCALHSMRHCPELSTYYHQKVDVEGKAPMMVLNAIRYKIILRIFACVHQNRLYSRDYVRTTVEKLPKTIPEEV